MKDDEKLRYRYVPEADSNKPTFEELIPDKAEQNNLQKQITENFAAYLKEF